ncbi:MAG: hypothetical protein RIA63_13260 [Cyclobacteriaceae bacterium]
MTSTKPVISMVTAVYDVFAFSMIFSGLMLVELFVVRFGLRKN